MMTDNPEIDKDFDELTIRSKTHLKKLAATNFHRHIQKNKQGWLASKLKVHEVIPLLSHDESVKWGEYLEQLDPNEHLTALVSFLFVIAQRE